MTDKVRFNFGGILPLICNFIWRIIKFVPRPCRHSKWNNIEYGVENDGSHQSRGRLKDNLYCSVVTILNFNTRSPDPRSGTEKCSGIAQNSKKITRLFSMHNRIPREFPKSLVRPRNRNFSAPDLALDNSECPPRFKIHVVSYIRLLIWNEGYDVCGCRANRDWGPRKKSLWYRPE